MHKIQIPSFDDFLADMGSDRIAEWAESIDGMPLAVGNPFSPEFVQQFATNLLVASHRHTVEMLRDYHEWLIQQLSQRSVHLL